jgi:hypothetical protein
MKMKLGDYNKIYQSYRTSLFVVLVLATIAMVYNKLVLNDAISNIIYAGVISYAVATIINLRLLKRAISEKKK